MKKFKFRLQGLLELREAKEKEIMNELSVLVAEQNTFINRRDSLVDSLQNQGKAYRKKMSDGTFSPSDAMLYGRFMDRSVRAIETEQKKADSMLPGIAEVRGRLVDASVSKKVVEKLKEKKLAEYSYEAAREEAKESDDANQKIYMRNRTLKMEQIYD